MKVLYAATLLTVASATWMRSSDRARLSAKAIKSVSDEIDSGSVPFTIGKALIAYISANGISDASGNVPDSWINWYRMEEGEVPCNGEDGDCNVGFMDLTPLWGYGCWCFFGNIDSTLGRGPPIDHYDGVCKELTQCYRCIIHDADNEGDDECDPYNTEFESSLMVSGSFGINNITTSCQTSNQNSCQWRTCSCAMTMVSNFFNLSFDTETEYDENMKHSNGFDYNLECPQQGRAQDRQCCGYYPNRRTFDRSEFRDCCHQKSIYNPLRHQCCDSGEHVGLGARC